jgi:predicted dehydrogenase
MAKFKALLVGAGGMGRQWGKNLKSCEETELVAWVDIRPGAAEKAAAKLELPNVITGSDLRDAISAAKPDFVVDVTIPEAHHDVTLTALAAGLPVIGEKPMADTMERARAMVRASEQAKKLYMVSQSRRYNNNLAALRALIANRLGGLGILNSDFYIGAHFGGFRDEMKSPLLLDMAIHTVDAARYLSGADPVAVYCDEFNPSWSWYKGSAGATVIFEMTGGLRYTYRGSWCSEGGSTSWDAEWRAVGPEGTAAWDGTNAPVAHIVKERGEFICKTEAIEARVDAGHEGIAASLRDFLRALDTGQPPMGECHDNIKSLAMVFAAVESASQRQRIAIAV